MAEDVEVFEKGVFRLVYQRQGEEAVRLDDGNANGIPDQVENIAIQLAAARDVFHSVLAFPDPLTSERYAQTEGVVVWLRSAKSMKGQHGLAFSVASRSRYVPGKWLKMQIATNIDARRNPTPAHEYFHLIQYGQANFKNAWYLEGMARWSEDLVQRVPVLKKRELPGENVWEATYQASNLLWRPLAGICGGRTALPESLKTTYRYVDGSPVFHDHFISGAQAMREMLLCLHRKEKDAAGTSDLEMWRKKTQRSPANNPLIFECVREVQSACQRKSPQ
ncbi:MAG: hypothetical protein K6G15_00615 [Desulfovibrio sp.]|nr:hypothetical protein [Desulfovibrio sp.]